MTGGIPGSPGWLADARILDLVFLDVPNRGYMDGMVGRSVRGDFLRSLGADEAIDYHTVDFTEAVKDVDVVLDPVSLDTAARARSLAVLRPGGTLVSILPVAPVGPDELADIAERGIRFESLLVEADRAGMQAIADLVETGALRAHIEATFPLAEAAKAHILGETGRTTGKIVLTVEGTVKKQIRAGTCAEGRVVGRPNVKADRVHTWALGSGETPRGPRRRQLDRMGSSLTDTVTDPLPSLHP